MNLIKEIAIGLISNLIVLALGWLVKILYAKIKKLFEERSECGPAHKEWSPVEAKKNFYWALTTMVVAAGMSAVRTLPLTIRLVFALISFIAFLSVWGIFDILYDITAKLQNSQSSQISEK